MAPFSETLRTTWQRRRWACSQETHHPPFPKQYLTIVLITSPPFPIFSMTVDHRQTTISFKPTSLPTSLVDRFFSSIFYELSLCLIFSSLVILLSDLDPPNCRLTSTLGAAVQPTEERCRPQPTTKPSKGVLTESVLNRKSPPPVFPRRPFKRARRNAKR